jgi:hypothetical protein
LEQRVGLAVQVAQNLTPNHAYAAGALGGTWNRNGDILIGALMGTQRVSDTGGPLSDLPGHPALYFPSFLPDGRHFVGMRGGDLTRPGIWIASMGALGATRILPDESAAEVAAPPPGSRLGAILFTRSGTPMALPFDMKRLQAAGAPWPITEGVAPAVDNHWVASTSGQGVIAWLTGQSSAWQYVWRDRQGKELGAIPNAGTVVMISPDGKRFLGESRGGLSITDIGKGVVTQLTFGPSAGSNPIWSSDGRYVAYYRARDGIDQKPANGAGAEEILLRTHSLSVPKSWSPDGKYLIYAQITSPNGADLFALSVEGGHKPLVLANTLRQRGPGAVFPRRPLGGLHIQRIRPSEIYVIPFPPNPSGGKWMVSHGGGVQPRWRRDGKELFYISTDWKMMAVDVSTRPTFQPGTPQPLFDTNMVDTGIRTGPISWDIAPDGKRFLIITPGSPDASSLNVILNWRPEQEK